MHSQNFAYPCISVSADFSFLHRNNVTFTKTANILLQSYIRFELLNVEHCLFVCCVRFVAGRPKSTAMVMVGRLVHLTTPFPGKA